MHTTATINLCPNTMHDSECFNLRCQLLTFVLFDLNPVSPNLNMYINKRSGSETIFGCRKHIPHTQIYTQIYLGVPRVIDQRPTHLHPHGKQYCRPLLGGLLKERQTSKSEKYMRCLSMSGHSCDLCEIFTKMPVDVVYCVV